MAISKIGLFLTLPILVKGSAYLLLGSGAIASGLGYQDVANLMLAVASAMGMGDAMRDARIQ